LCGRGPEGLQLICISLGGDKTLLLRAGTVVQQLIEYLMAQASGWVRAERELHRQRGRPLPARDFQALSGFLPSDLLAMVRVAEVPRITNPPFYADLQRAGIPMPLDFSVMAGITFEDVIVISRAASIPPQEWLPLLFHELVHVIQYSMLGVERFAREYIAGWAANGLRYEAIPLERDAYELDARYRQAPTQYFDVHREVKHRLVSRGIAA
jgi:hypothetical protein